MSSYNRSHADTIELRAMSGDVNGSALSCTIEFDRVLTGSVRWIFRCANDCGMQLSYSAGCRTQQLPQVFRATAKEQRSSDINSN